MRLSDACWHSCILHLASLAQLQYNVTSPVLLRRNLNCKKKKISRNVSSRTDLGNLTQTDIQVACICMLPHSNAAIKTVLQQVTVSSCWISCLQVALLLWLITIVHQLLKAVSASDLGSVAYHNCSSTAVSAGGLGSVAYHNCSSTAE